MQQDAIYNKVPSLAEQAQKQAVRTLRSPEARFLLDHDPLDPVPALAAEAAHLNARGRIMGHGVTDGAVIVNAPGNKIDGVRLYRYDASRRVVTVRADHSTLPSFWLEFELPLQQLEAWLGREMDDQEESMEWDESFIM